MDQSANYYWIVSLVGLKLKWDGKIFPVCQDRGTPYMIDSGLLVIQIIGVERAVLATVEKLLQGPKALLNTVLRVYLAVGMIKSTPCGRPHLLWRNGYQGQRLFFPPTFFMQRVSRPAETARRRSFRCFWLVVANGRLALIRGYLLALTFLAEWGR